MGPPILFGRQFRLPDLAWNNLCPGSELISECPTDRNGKIKAAILRFILMNIQRRAEVLNLQAAYQDQFVTFEGPGH